MSDERTGNRQPGEGGQDPDLAGPVQPWSQVRALQDAYLQQGYEQRLQAATARFAEATAGRRSNRRPLRWVAALSLAAAGAIAALWILPQGADQAITIETEHAAPGDGNTVAPGQVVKAPAQAPLPLRFSDGSRIALQGGSVARVDDVGRNFVDLTLSRGRADVAVKPHQGVRWRLMAGPFLVSVKGTKFDLHWSPEEHVFLLALREGAVTVRGPLLEGQRRVAGGENLRIDLVNQSVDQSSADDAGGDPVPPPADGETEDVTNDADPEPDIDIDADIDEPGLPSRPPVRRPSRPTGHTDSPSWKDLAGGRHYDEAMKRVAEIGLKKLCTTQQAGDLLVVADIARAAGKTPVAKSVYRCIRSRFSDSDDAALAAYMLGRLAFEVERDDRAATRWFAGYLKQRPNGPLAEAAMGRLMEAQQRRGDVRAAQQSAHRYLGRFKGGPHADLAGRLLADEAAASDP